MEWNYGEYEGLAPKQIHAKTPGWMLFSDGCPGGESPEPDWRSGRSGDRKSPRGERSRRAFCPWPYFQSLCGPVARTSGRSGMSFPSRYGDLKHPELLSKHSGGEALERHGRAIEEYSHEGHKACPERSRREHEEKNFTAENPARRSRNQRFGISPAKTQRPQRKLLSELGALRALAGGISESEMFCVVIRFARGAQILKHSNAKDAKTPSFILPHIFVGEERGRGTYASCIFVVSVSFCRGSVRLVKKTIGGCNGKSIDRLKSWN